MVDERSYMGRIQEVEEKVEKMLKETMVESQEKLKGGEESPPGHNLGGGESEGGDEADKEGDAVQCVSCQLLNLVKLFCSLNNILIHKRMIYDSLISRWRH